MRGGEFISTPRKKRAGGLGGAPLAPPSSMRSEPALEHLAIVRVLQAPQDALLVREDDLRPVEGHPLVHPPAGHIARRAGPGESRPHGSLEADGSGRPRRRR